MTDRQVTHTRKDRDGDILALCNPGEAWSPRPKDRAIQDLGRGTRYYTLVNGDRATVYAVNDDHGLYLSTSQDGSTHNNLGELPDC